jgi:transcription antitermination factor NusG
MRARRRAGDGARIRSDGRRVRSRSDTVVQRPLFVGYIFVKLADDQQWSPIAQSRNVERIITAGVDQIPVLLRQEVIDQLREDEKAGLWDETKPRQDLRRLLDKGERPSVAVPELYDVTGQLLELDEQGRARVLLERMLGSVVLTVDGRGLKLVAA